MNTEAVGKYLFVGGKKFTVKGVTYGNFDPKDTGTSTFFFDEERTRRDFELMKKANVNTVRFYAKPPDYVMEIAKQLGLKVILTLFVDYTRKGFSLFDRRVVEEYKELARDLVSFGKRHGNVLLYLLGTEIPELLLQQKGISAMEEFVKENGIGNFEDFIFELHKTAKETDSGCLTSYSNFPPTEFLDLNFLDVVTYDVYLHKQKKFKDYVSKLQNQAGNRPLLVGEVGADSLREGERFQANLLEWSMETALEGGCCGVVAYTFADGWWSGEKVTAWRMGLVSEDRKPKLAYATVKRVFGAKRSFNGLPKISVVVAGYNEERHIAACIESLQRVDYPKSKMEIIVVSDGSKDKTVKIARKYPIKVVELKQNRGLSFARNAGAEAATGEIVAYTDADCRVDVDWLYHIARSFDSKSIGCVGGPNVTPPEDSFLAQCVSRAPGCPTHVLIDDTRADHVPGCNMAFRKSVLKKIGGFDEIFRIAGDDVDLEWRLQKAGYHVRYNPAAQVLHYRRNTVKAYVKQQLNYGVSEAFVRRAHPERFSGFHAIWNGAIYNTYNNAANDLLTLFQKPVIYFDWFPQVSKPAPNYLLHLPLDLRWYACSLVMLSLTPVSLNFSAIGVIMLLLTMATCLAIGKLSVERRHSSAKMAVKELLAIAFLSLVWSLARKYGQLKGWVFTKMNRDTRGIALAGGF